MRVFFSALFLILVSTLGATAEEPAAVTPDVEGKVCTEPAEQIGGSQPEIFQQVGTAEACTASANCTEGPDVNCSGNNNCTAFDQNCSTGQRGYVECDGNRMWCAICPCNLQLCRQSCRSGCSSGCFCFGSCVNGSCECDQVCF